MATHTTTLSLIDELIEQNVTDELDAYLFLVKDMPDGLVNRAISSSIDKEVSLDELTKAAIEFETQWESNVDGEDSAFVQFLNETGESKERWPSEPAPIVAVFSRMTKRGISDCQVIGFVSQLIGRRRVVEILCKYIDDEGLSEHFQKYFMIGQYRNNPSLITLESSIRRAGVNFRYARVLAIDFVDRTVDEGLLGVLCRQIEADGAIEDLRLACKNMLRIGVPEEEHDYLEDREWMISRDVLNHSEDRAWDLRERSEGLEKEWNADPAREEPWRSADVVRLPPSEWCMTIDITEDDIPISTGEDEFPPCQIRFPDPGKPIALDEKDAMQCLAVLRDSGLLTLDAVRGFAVEFVEQRLGLRFLELLCRRIEAEALGSAFQTFVEAALNGELEEYKFLRASPREHEISPSN
jgi:hypothetical protein